MKEEKCEFCGCRGESSICYYNCGCHKPNDKEVLPKKWIKENLLYQNATFLIVSNHHPIVNLYRISGTLLLELKDILK